LPECEAGGDDRRVDGCPGRLNRKQIVDEQIIHDAMTDVFVKVIGKSQTSVWARSRRGSDERQGARKRRPVGTLTGGSRALVK
jgi:hypothetical protein